MAVTHTLRIPQIDLASILEEQNPYIELRTSIYENSTKNFLKALTSYKNRAITTISDRRKHQAVEKKKYLERTHAAEVETNQCKLKEIELVADLEREKEERKEAELSVAAFKRQLGSLREKCAAIDAEIEQYRAINEDLHREKNKERSTLSEQASHIPLELNATERRLSCVVEGIETDQLLIRFHSIDISDPHREVSFVLDLSGSMFKVITSSPHLPTLPILVESLNTTKDIYAFIRQIRKSYQEMI